MREKTIEEARVDVCVSNSEMKISRGTALLAQRCMTITVMLLLAVLQCVAVCCSVLQCVAVCCSVLQCVAV